MGKGLYKRDIQEDFLIYKPDWPNGQCLAISVKRQEKQGSTDQKLEYTYNEITECYPCPCAVILDGPELLAVEVVSRGWEHVEKSKGQVAYIFASLGTFNSWLTRGSLWPEAPKCVAKLFTT